MRWNLWRLALLASGGIIPLLSFFMEARVAREVKTYLREREDAELHSRRRPLVPDPRDPDGEPAVTEQTETSQRPVLVVDFGAQYAQLIARRVREAGVYSEIVPHTASAADIAAKNPVGIILSGGPSSVYEEGAPALDAGVFDLGVPTLGICYGFQVMAQALGGEVANTGLREYGATDAALTGDGGVLLAGQPAEQNVWMSHGDQVVEGPRGLRRARLDVRHSGRRVRQRRAPHVRRAVASRGQALRLRSAGHRELPPQGRGARPPTGTAATSSPSRSSASARRSAPAA